MPEESLESVKTLMDIDLRTIHSGYDRKTCWVHARQGIIPASDGRPAHNVVTMTKASIIGSDIFHEIGHQYSDDGGQTWSEVILNSDTLGRRPIGNGIEEGISDFWPKWHAKTGVMLGIGHTIRYKNNELTLHPRPRSTAYSIYDPDTRTWCAWRKMEGLDDPRFFNEGAGSTQRLDLPDGEILLPTYVVIKGTARGIFDFTCFSTVMRCTFDGETLRYLEHGSELSIPEGRGFAEPSLARANGRYFLTLRNDNAGYVATSDDGLHYDEPRRWTFDDGSDLGNYNTQQHWVTHNRPDGRDELYLVYTRRGANNDHIPRHRAPLFIAQVDLCRLCVLRDTERVLVPERGAKLGNFGVVQVSGQESWVTVAEWMQTTPPNPFDCRVCERYGSNNSVFLARIRFGQITPSSS